MSNKLMEGPRSHYHVIVIHLTIDHNIADIFQISFRAIKLNYYGDETFLHHHHHHRLHSRHGGNFIGENISRS